MIEARLKLYHPIIPFYFGLFLNEEDSSEILLLGQELFLKSLKHFPKLREDLEKVARKQSEKENLRKQKRSTSFSFRNSGRVFFEPKKYEKSFDSSTLYNEILRSTR